MLEVHNVSKDCARAVNAVIEQCGACAVLRVVIAYVAAQQEGAEEQSGSNAEGRQTIENYEQLDLHLTDALETAEKLAI